MAAVLVGISPLFVKRIGDDMSVPTIGGTVIAAFVTLAGSIGQVSALTWQGAELTSGWVRGVVLALGIGVGAVVVCYAIRALWSYIKTGATVGLPKRPDALKAADVVASAIKTREDVGKREKAKDEAFAPSKTEVPPETEEPLEPTPIRIAGNSLL